MTAPLPDPVHPGRDAALRAAVGAARAAGLRVRDPVVLADRSNLLVHLRPAPVVARVPLGTAAVRPGAAWLEREVAVARHLATQGAPVVAPSTDVDPGPHRHDGRPVTFWALAEETGEPLDAPTAGRGLRACHAALADFAGDLPEHAIFHEARAILDRLLADGALGPGDAARVRRWEASLTAAIGALEVPLQAVHGDAHLGNVVQTARGPLWNDFEDTFRGPPEWDVACLVAAARVFARDPGPPEAALEAYGDPGDPALLALMLDARVYVGLAWTLVVAPHRVDGAQRVAARLDWLRAREPD
jgi:aminoglycoside phosphotransferase (APT) family kinase protein